MEAVRGGRHGSATVDTGTENDAAGDTPVFSTDRFERCFGVRDHLSIETADGSSVDANTAQQLLSSLTIACNNCSSELPVFVQAPGLPAPGEGGHHWMGLHHSSSSTANSSSNDHHDGKVRNSTNIVTTQSEMPIQTETLIDTEK